MSDVAAISASGVAKSFGGVHAVRGCSFEVAAKSITGLIGPNGAGKTTMLSLIAGSLEPDEGTIAFFGQPHPGMAHLVARMGVARTFQIPSEFRHLTVLENLLVATPNHPGESVWRALRHRNAWLTSETEALERAWSLLERFQISRLANEPAENLSGGQKKLLEFARALQAAPRLLLLDEPMAGVNPALRDELEGHIGTFAAEGITVLMIEHEMGIVSRLCDDVVVMAEGQVIAQGPFADIKDDQRVKEAYLGQTVGGEAHA